jgi:hypothetical protein
MKKPGKHDNAGTSMELKKLITRERDGGITGLVYVGLCEERKETRMAGGRTEKRGAKRARGELPGSLVRKEGSLSAEMDRAKESSRDSWHGWFEPKKDCQQSRIMQNKER